MRYACWYIALAVCCNSWTPYTHCWIRVVCCTTPAATVSIVAVVWVLIQHSRGRYPEPGWYFRRYSASTLIRRWCRNSLLVPLTYCHCVRSVTHTHRQARTIHIPGQSERKNWIMCLNVENDGWIAPALPCDPHSPLPPHTHSHFIL